MNVSSHQALRPVPGALPYATAKAAIEGLTRAVAVDYGPRGVRCNAVALGSIADRALGLALGRTRRWRRCTRSAGSAPPSEVADVVALLLERRAS